MRFPATDDAGDFLIYHRMTGLGQGPGGYTTAADVAVLRRGGCVLEPYSEREADDDEYGPEMFGIQTIDIAAGDGGAVFCSPFAPVDPGEWGMSEVKNTPGFAFRLGDLTALHPVSVRPIDFQNFYLQLVSVSPIAGAYDRMRDQAEEHHHPHFMEPLVPAFELIRRAETFDAFAALDGIIRTGAARQLAKVTGEVTASDISAAAASAYDFIYEFEIEGADLDIDDAIVANVVDLAAATIRDSYLDALESWERVGFRRGVTDAEVLVWGSVPLSLAVLAFDSEDIIELEPLEAIAELAGVPAAKVGNG